jgi:hypothetical protein
VLGVFVWDLGGRKKKKKGRSSFFLDVAAEPG